MVKSKKVREESIADNFSDPIEKKYAKELLKKYIEDYSIESASDQNTINQLIYLEVLQTRLQHKLNDMYGTEDLKAIPYNVIEIVHKNSDAISKIKATLGLSRLKEKAFGYDALNHLRERFKLWRNSNQATRHIKCPHCMKFIWLKMRTEAWEAKKHPYFQDNMICNKHLLKNLGQTVVIDSTFIANVLEVSPDYIDWVLKKQEPHENPKTETEKTIQEG